MFHEEELVYEYDKDREVKTPLCSRLLLEHALRERTIQLSRNHLLNLAHHYFNPLFLSQDPFGIHKEPKK